jgi:hypothetical protein
VAAGAVYGLHRLALWMEARGWISYRKKHGSSGGLGTAFLEVQSLLEPSTRHVLELRRNEDFEDEDSGDPPNEAPVEIVPYDPSWPARFDEERERLLEAIGAWLVGPIEHIGSTAVRGLPAKPVIDIMAGVRTLDASRPAIAAVAGLGYCYSPYRPDTEHWFCKPSLAFRTHHLHLVPFGSTQWTE